MCMDALMPRAQATDRDVGRYDSREGGSRTASGIVVESNAGAIAETSEVRVMHGSMDGGRLQGCRR